jgi:hypothetical protein
VEVPVRVDVRDLHAAVAHEGELGRDLALELGDREPAEKRAKAHRRRRGKAARLVDERRDLARVGGAALVAVPHEREVHPEALVGAIAGVGQGVVHRRHRRHDRRARERPLLEALDRGRDGLGRGSEVVGVHDDAHEGLPGGAGLSRPACRPRERKASAP